MIVIFIIFIVYWACATKESNLQVMKELYYEPY
jgi:hypothetical protein